MTFHSPKKKPAAIHLFNEFAESPVSMRALMRRNAELERLVESLRRVLRAKRQHEIDAVRRREQRTLH